MRKLLLIIGLVNVMIFSTHTSAQCPSTTLYNSCKSGIPASCIFIKSFNVETSGTEVSYVFSKGTTYVITTCGNTDNNMKFELFDRDHKLIASNYDASSKACKPKVGYPCAATGVYYMKYTYLNGHNDCGVSMIAFVKQ